MQTRSYPRSKRLVPPASLTRDRPIHQRHLWKTGLPHRPVQRARYAALSASRLQLPLSARIREAGEQILALCWRDVLDRSMGRRGITDAHPMGELRKAEDKGSIPPIGSRSMHQGTDPGDRQ